jgi:hypothetical protein
VYLGCPMVPNLAGNYTTLAQAFATPRCNESGDLSNRFYFQATIMERIVFLKHADGKMSSEFLAN